MPRLRILPLVLATVGMIAMAAVGAGAAAHHPAATMTTVMEGKALVSGKSETVLTNDRGLTLYYLKGATATNVICTGSCAKAWPPLLLPSGSPTGPKGLTGLTAAKTKDGRMVLLGGHPLFTFVGDKKPGQANGEGLKKIWFVATPALDPAAKASSSSGGGW